MYVAVTYDIQEDRRRARFARLLEGYGERVQRSVFECDLTARQFTRLLQEVTRFIEPDDGIRVYRFPRASEESVLVLGGVEKVHTPKFIVV